MPKIKGPIPPSSFAYYKTPDNTLNIDAANKLLDETGYIRGLNGTRVKGTDNLSFEIVLVNNKDREDLANQIKDNLAKVGIDIQVTSTDLGTVLDQYILPKDFQLLLYGVQTFIDPDRYELFHSSQIEHPGLNISGYISSNLRTQVVDGKTTKISAVDDDLADGRRLVDEAARIKKYDDFQKVINEDVPEVFLFYPKEVYLVNSRVKNVNMNDVNSASERFESVDNWEIK